MRRSSSTTRSSAVALGLLVAGCSSQPTTPDEAVSIACSQGIDGGMTVTEILDPETIADRASADGLYEFVAEGPGGSEMYEAHGTASFDGDTVDVICSVAVRDGSVVGSPLYSRP